MQRKITTKERRRTLNMVTLGSAPFASVNCRGGKRAWIPNGLKGICYSDGLYWIVETRVRDGIAQFKCTCQDDESKTSEWEKNPSKAYKIANKSNPNYTRGSNGRLVFGVTYEAIQEEILTLYKDELPVETVMQPKSKKRLSDKNLDREFAEPPKKQRIEPKSSDNENNNFDELAFLAVLESDQFLIELEQSILFDES